MPTSADILERFSLHRSHIDNRQALTPAYFEFLKRLGNPHQHLPPVFHVAGTNGKGSTCAFLRAILEAAGYKVHVYTSPHLVRFHERIRIAGKLISEEELVELLTVCQDKDQEAQVSAFEAITAVAFAAFSRTPADFVILETGLGGRLDATNVVEKPLATLITRLSYDHRDFLGHTLTQIAREKAGIMRTGVPCFTSAQSDAESISSLREAAAEIKAPLFMGGDSWRVTPTSAGFYFDDAHRHYDLPAPALLGAHQFQNAGLAIAVLLVLPKPLSQEVIAKGLQTAEWPARLQPIKQGVLADLVPQNAELWLDGGHNDSAGEVLAIQAQKWALQDGANPKPLCLIYGMLTTKKPQEFLQPLLPHIALVRTVTIPNKVAGFTASDLATKVRDSGIQKVKEAVSVRAAISEITQQVPNARILICGSLYLAGDVLKYNAGE